MADQTSNDKAQAAMREQNSTNLNTSGKAGVIPCAPKQVKNPTKHTSQGKGGPYGTR